MPSEQTNGVSSVGREAVTAPLRPEHVAALVGPVLDGGRAEAVGVYAPGPWAGGDTVTVGEREHPVLRCPSPLAVREALDRYEAAGGPPPVLLVPFEGEALGWDVFARLAKRQLLAMAPWDVVRDQFRARRVDPRIVSEVWMAHLLMERAPVGGYPPVPGDVLDSDTAWSHVLAEVLSVEARRLDVDALLAASAEPAFAEGYRGLPDAARESVRRHVERAAGPLASALVAAIEAGNGDRLLALGLACGVLFPEAGAGSVELDRAAVRLEGFLDGRPLGPDQGRDWAAAARRVTDRLPPAHRARVFSAAESVLDTVQASSFAGLSDVLPGGYERRIERLGAALAAVLDGRGTPQLAADALARVERHHRALADEEAARVERLRMAVRLLRYLDRSRPTPAASLETAIRGYVREGSFVDWARSLLVGGDRDGGVAAALDRLSERVREVRERENQAFAGRFAAWNEAPKPLEGAVLIEEVVQKVVAPVAGEAPVLVLVLDGMGFASFRQLLDPLLQRGWAEWTAGEGQERLAALAVLPSITRLSRTSLLSGALSDGTARDEKRAFASAGRLTKVSTSGKPPALFHKGDLQEGASAALSSPVRAALADAGQRVVGVVLNVLDDSLAKSDQQLPVWDLDRIRLLGSLLEEARATGRALVLASDHGHVLEADGTALPGDGQERWRTYSEPVADEEVVVRGPRVRDTLGQDSVVVPWSERVRYVRKKAGYHGGAALQELVVPVALFAPIGLTLAGADRLREAPPVWWTPFEKAPAEPTKAGKKAKRTRKRADAQATLFAPEEPGGGDHPGWAELVVQSPAYAAQRALMGRVAPEDEEVVRVLDALGEARGRADVGALANALGQSLPELHDQLVSLQRVLNVEGYPVLSYDEGEGRVRLDLDLAGRTFGVALP